MAKFSVLLAVLGLLAACGSPVATPAGSPSASGSGGPSSAQSGAAGSQAAPEKPHISVARSAPGGTFIPVLIAQDAGYFKNHGLEVELEMVAPPVANQGLVSGSLDIYEGATSVVTAILGGAPLVYVAAPVDRNNQKLVGKPGLTTIESLRGRSVSTLSAGAFGEIALRWSAKQAGLQVGKDITPIFNPDAQSALAVFQTGQADALLEPPPFVLVAENAGSPVIVDYAKAGLRVVGPGTAVTRDFLRKNPNTIKAFLEAYLDGVKRAFDDPGYAKQVDVKYSKLDQSLVDDDYKYASGQWNKDMTIVPEAIQVTLDASQDPKAQTMKPADFYDNSIIQAVNRAYASKLFPNDIK
jgi:NitT/TauT family transport system substrate-binding protein